MTCARSSTPSSTSPRPAELGAICQRIFHQFRSFLSMLKGSLCKIFLLLAIAAISGLTMRFDTLRFREVHRRFPKAGAQLARRQFLQSNRSTHCSDPCEPMNFLPPIVLARLPGMFLCEFERWPRHILLEPLAPRAPILPAYWQIATVCGGGATDETTGTCKENRGAGRSFGRFGFLAGAGSHFNYRHYRPKVPPIQFNAATRISVALFLRLRNVRIGPHIHQRSPCSGRHPARAPAYSLEGRSRTRSADRFPPTILPDLVLVWDTDCLAILHAGRRISCRFGSVCSLDHQGGASYWGVTALHGRLLSFGSSHCP